MKAVILKIITVAVTCGGLVLSIIEQNPLVLCGFLLGGLISYELAVIIGNKTK